MFLKRIEVVGFKSFADRIGIDFVPGVTAVVGPNGSGKSNVTDAIRWVLGEQSAKSLRGTKMEDVIFAGSQSRKPLNFAEVTLILDNEDQRIPISYSEISVTRRVYRSGESEYLLNNQQCRLRDITDLFLDSGLGKEAFSIISQGKVDEILNSRPDNRRPIFEEAAGVLKYKLRKIKAEQKLNETDDNLNRVLDILHELDSRLEPLQMQASTAKDYLRMTEELKELDISLIVHDLRQYGEQLEKVQRTHNQLKIEEKEQSSNISSLEKKVEETRNQLKQLDHQLDISQEQLVEASSEVERWEGRKALMQEKRQNTQKQLQKLQDDLQQATKEVTSLQQTEEKQKRQFNQKQKDFNTLKASIKQLEKSLNRSASEIEQEIEQNKNIYIDLLNEEATVKNDLKHIEQQLIQQQETAKKISNQSEDLMKRLQDITEIKEKIEKDLHLVEQKLQEKLNRHEALQQQLQNATNMLDKKQQLLYQAYQHQQQLKARKETLAELEADFSGFYQGVKEVLLARDRGELTGIKGAVAELIQVESKYSKAIETALGAASQHIVTNTEQDAQKAIRYLKMKKAGRATFLPQSVIKSRKLHSSQYEIVKQHPDFISLAHELITYNAQYQSIVENLLGNVLVAKSLQSASEIARSCGYRYRVVTLDGDIVNAGGSLTGGALKRQSSLFTRKAELESLTGKLSQMEQNILQAETAVASEKEALVTLRQQLEEAAKQGETLRKKQMEYKGKLVELEVEEKNLQTTVHVTVSEQSSTSSKTDFLVEQKEEFKQRLQQIKEKLQNTSQHVDQLTKLKIQGEHEKDTIREQLAQKRSELAVLQEQLSQLQISIAELTLDRTKSEKRVDSISQEINWLIHDKENGPTDEEITQTVQDWNVKKDTLTSQISQLRQQRHILQQTQSKLEENLKEIQQIYKVYLEKLRGIEIKRSKIEFEMNRLHTLLEEYELDFEEAMEEAISIEDANQIRKKVKLLKISIEELGPVNLTAIEEHERVLERHSFLTVQRNDLLEAQQTLQDTIEEMDEEISIRFRETFSMIQMHFKHVFRELFGGGQADLILLEPDQILETGIEIVAQPPGKKLQSLSLLSGGERALTAIALLFAILNTRPVPFVILDEVEAALDEANVSRYSAYLKKLSSYTQFIVITHRKGTMEEADALYGITMQESGVSKLVSVKLEEKVELVGQRSGS